MILRCLYCCLYLPYVCGECERFGISSHIAANVKVKACLLLRFCCVALIVVVYLIVIVIILLPYLSMHMYQDNVVTCKWLFFKFWLIIHYFCLLLTLQP